jgi:hypothetical protein
MPYLYCKERIYLGVTAPENFQGWRQNLIKFKDREQMGKYIEEKIYPQASKFKDLEVFDEEFDNPINHAYASGRQFIDKS